MFIALATVSWTLGALGKDEPITQAATSAHDLFGRGTEPEVLSSFCGLDMESSRDESS